jgi:Ca2+-binding EF-hand superfamily protein
MMDQDGSGVLSTAELKQAFRNMKTGLEENELDEVVSRFDKDGGGRIEKSEFVNVMTDILEGC